MAICSDNRHIFVILIHTSYPTSLSTRHAFQSHNKTNSFFSLKTLVIIVIQLIKMDFYNDKLDDYVYINFTQLELSLDQASPFFPLVKRKRLVRDLFQGLVKFVFLLR